jgi:hypothetical protein
VEAAHDSSPVVADVDVPLRQQSQHLGWSAARTGRSPGDRSAATATDSASFG